MMTPKRLLTLKRLLGGLATGAFCAAAAAAGPFPSQPITLVNPYAAGGPPTCWAAPWRANWKSSWASP